MTIPKLVNLVLVFMLKIHGVLGIGHVDVLVLNLQLLFLKLGLVLLLGYLEQHLLPFLLLSILTNSSHHMVNIQC